MSECGGTVRVSGNGPGGSGPGVTGSRRTLASRIAAPFWWVTGLLYGYRMPRPEPEPKPVMSDREYMLLGHPSRVIPVRSAREAVILAEQHRNTVAELGRQLLQAPSEAVRTQLPPSHPAMQLQREMDLQAALVAEQEERLFNQQWAAVKTQLESVFGGRGL